MTILSITKQISEADAGRLIELSAGDKLEITLPGNPTTGFQWDVSAGDPAVLQLSDEPEFESSDSMVGGKGNIILRFTAVGPGEIELKLIYHRPFEKDLPYAQTFNVTVTVR